MEKTAEVYEFCLAWLMGYDTVDTLQAWFYEMNLSFQEVKEISKMNGWWVTSMEQIQYWENNKCAL